MRDVDQFNFVVARWEPAEPKREHNMKRTAGGRGLCVFVTMCAACLAFVCVLSLSADRAYALDDQQQADAEVLTACIPSQAWERSTRWEWSAGAFHKVDKSHIQVQLIVKHDDKLAVIRPVNLYKNHLKGDTINAWSMDAIEDELQPHRFMLLGKVK